MLSRTVVIQRSGENLQSTTDLIRLAKGFKSVIQISHSSASANAKSTLGVVALGLQPGMTVTLQADGPDEEQALAAISTFLT